MKTKSGIYGIKINDKFEVGYSKDFKTRWSSHRNYLEMNKHWNIKLQRAYNKYSKCEFSVLEETTEWLAEKEIMWIDKLKSRHPGGYNLTEGGDGGDTFSLLDEEAKRQRAARMSKTMKKRKHNMGKKNGMFGLRGEKHPSFGNGTPGINKGEKNGNYKGYDDKQVYDTFISCGSYKRAVDILSLSMTTIRVKVSKYAKENSILLPDFRKTKERREEARVFALRQHREKYEKSLDKAEKNGYI